MHLSQSPMFLPFLHIATPSCCQTRFAYAIANRSGVVLLARLSLVVSGIALAGSVGSAVAQYVPQQLPPVGSPPPTSYSYPAYPPYDAEAEDYPLPDSYSYPPYRRAEAPDDYPPPASYSYPAGPPRYSGAYESSDAEPSES